MHVQENRMAAIWRGVFPAATTKMTEDGQVDLKATQLSLNRLIENGVSGVIVLPMLGENASLSPAERETVIRAAVEVVSGRVPLLSGLAEITLDTAKAHARAYESFGVQGLMVFPSLGYKTDPRETTAWYGGIASASSLPIMIYNNPIAYGVDVTPEILKNLADARRIVCVKGVRRHSEDYGRVDRAGRSVQHFLWSRRPDRRECGARRHG